MDEVHITQKVSPKDLNPVEKQITRLRHDMVSHAHTQPKRCGKASCNTLVANILEGCLA